MTLPKLDFTLWRAARLKEAAEAKAKILKDAEPGQRIAGEGIFLGQYQSKDLGKIFNVFAAPEDLPDTMKYVDAVKYIAELKGWHGFDGTNYATDKEFNQALKEGTYTGGWIIPTRELLIGTEADGPSRIGKGTVIQPDNLYDHRNKGAFKGTFTTAANYPQWYWSCMEHRDHPSDVWFADFSDGYEGWDNKDYYRLSCRPVRLVPVI